MTVIAARRPYGRWVSVLVALLSLSVGAISTFHAATAMIASAVVFAVFVTIGALRAMTRSGGRRAFLWLGALLPLVVDEVRTREEVAEQLITQVNLFHGIGPLAVLILYILVVRPRLRPISGTERALCAFAGLTILSAAWSLAPLATLLKGLNLATVMILLILVVREAGGQPAIIVNDLLRVALIICASALLAFLISNDSAYVQLGPNDPSYRLRGVLPAASPNSLAFVAAVAVVGLFVRRGPRPLQNSLGRGLAAVIAVAVLILSGTRSAIAVVILITLLLGIWNQRHRQRTVALSVILALGALIVFNLRPLETARWVLRGQTVDQLTTLTGRTTNWAAALEAWLERPIAGHGYYAGHRLSDLELTRGGLTSNLDSLWVETLVDVGIIGAGLLALVFAAAFLRIWKLGRMCGAERWEYEGAAGIIMMGFIMSFVNPSIQSVGYTLFFVGPAVLAISTDQCTSSRRRSFGSQAARLAD